jgi:hypothetical protein
MTWLTKEKVQKDKQQSTKHTYKTKDRVTRPPLKIGGELRIARYITNCIINIIFWDQLILDISA